MTPKKLLILSVSAGAGHVRAAEALKAWTEQKYADAAVQHVDLMTLVPRIFKTVYADTYVRMVETMPSFWGYLYNKADLEKQNSLGAKIRRAVERLNTTKFVKLLADVNPDHVVCTHFLPAELLSGMIRKRTFKRPVWVVDTDFDVHQFWVHPFMNGYFAASEEVAFRMADRGVDSRTIKVTGIPVMPAFSRKLSRENAARSLGLNPETFTLLVMAGGAGLGGMELLVRDLLRSAEDFQIIALAGRNESLLDKLQAQAKKFPRRLYAIPYTNTIEQLMACADVAVTKPGGLTTSECLAVGLPMIVISPIPGQEERNSDYLLEHGAAMKAVDAAGIVYRIRRLIRRPKEVEALSKKAKSLGKPKAALNILQTVLGNASR